MSDNGTFNFREASKFYSSLEDEVRDKTSTLKILKAIVDGKRTIQGLETSVKSLKDEHERYRNLIGIAKEDAQKAEDASILTISNCKARERSNDEQVKANIAANADRVKEVDLEANSKIAAINATVVNAEKASEERMAAIVKRESEANEKASKAEAALERVRSLVGGVV